MSSQFDFLLPPNFGLEEALLKKAPIYQVMQRWEWLGKPSIADYGFTSKKNGEQICVESTSNDLEFRVYFDPSFSPDYAEILSCVLANQIGHPKVGGENGKDFTVQT